MFNERNGEKMLVIIAPIYILSGLSTTKTLIKGVLRCKTSFISVIVVLSPGEIFENPKSGMRI